MKGQKKNTKPQQVPKASSLSSPSLNHGFQGNFWHSLSRGVAQQMSSFATAVVHSGQDMTQGNERCGKKKHEYQQTIDMGKNKSFHKNDLWGIYILYMYILHIYIYIPSCESSGEFLLPSFHCNWYEWLEPIAIMASLRWWSRNSPKSKVKFSNVLREKPWLHFPEGQLGQDSCHVAHLRCKISGYTKSPIENHSFVNGVSWFP